MKLQQGLEKTYEASWGNEEALCFEIEGNEHWLKRHLNNGRYEVCGLLAAGGFGCVFLALDHWNYDHKVVVKTPYYMGDYCRPYIARSRSAFEQQIRNLNKLHEWEKRHLVTFSNAGFDSIVNLNDYFEDRSLDLCKTFRNAAGEEYQVDGQLQENTPFLVLKYIRGEMLKDLLARKLPGQVKTLRLTKQVLVLLNYLHQPRKTKKGRPFYYMLCDLKAENIIVTDEEQVSLLDFGSVKIHWMDQQEIDMPAFITDGYAAPEIYAGGLEYPDNPRIDNRFDIFTVGALMAQSLTGIHPYEFLTAYTPPQHDFDLGPHKNISPAVKKVVQKATARSREDRYPTVDAMLKDVRRALKKLL